MLFSDDKGEAIDNVAIQTESFASLASVSPTSKRSKFQENPSSTEWSSRETDHSSVFGANSTKIG